jgi:hypothetical protein
VQLPLIHSDAVCGVIRPPSHSKPVLSSIPIHNNPVGLSLETWLANCGDCHVRSIAHGNDISGNFKPHMKNEEELRHDGNTYDLVYSKANPPNVRAIPPAEICGTLPVHVNHARILFVCESTYHFVEPFRNAPLTIKTVNYCTSVAVTSVPRLSLYRT